MSEKMVISFMFQIDTWFVLCLDEIFSGKIKHATFFQSRSLSGTIRDL